MSTSVSGHRAARRANLRSSFRLEFRFRARTRAIVSYPENERAVIHDSYRFPRHFREGVGSDLRREEKRKRENGSPVILDIEVLRGDGRVDGVIETLGRRDLVV